LADVCQRMSHHLMRPYAGIRGRQRTHFVFLYFVVTPAASFRRSRNNAVARESRESTRIEKAR
jgi:hypothetical protein